MTDITITDAQVLVPEVVNANTNTAVTTITAIPPVALPSDTQEDYIISRANFHDILTRGSLALGRLIEIADATQNRSDYRVVGELITAITNANEKLLEMHIKKKELLEAMQEPRPGTVNIDKAVFMTTNDLLNELTKQVTANT